MNLLEALNQLANNPDFKIPQKGKDYDNSIQEVGSGLEAFFKLLFVNQKKPEALSKAFCFQGSANHPPDLVTTEPQIAFEIKKRISDKGDIQLNSSYPEQCLSRSNHKLTQQCRNIISSEKIPLIYAIGAVSEETIDKLWLIDGALYAANQAIYTDAVQTISDAIKLSGIGNLHKTSELAQVREIDPLKITIMRVRGMWIIKHPSIVFSYLGDFGGRVTAIFREATYELFSQGSRKLIENNKNIHFEHKKCKNPDNPSKLESAIQLEL